MSEKGEFNSESQSKTKVTPETTRSGVDPTKRELTQTRWAATAFKKAHRGQPFRSDEIAAIRELGMRGAEPLSGGAWAEDELVNNPDANLRVKNPQILMRVVGPLDFFDQPTSDNLSDALKNLADLVVNGKVPANNPEVKRVRDAINAKIIEARKNESLLGTPEVPATPEAWLGLVRDQVRKLEQIEAIFPLNSPWENLLELRSSSGLPIGKALDRMQPEIANRPVTINAEGAAVTKPFKEWILGEIRGRQNLHNRYFSWLTYANNFKELSESSTLTGNGDMGPVNLIAVATMMAEPGVDGELAGDKVSKAFWAYRMIARGQPYSSGQRAENLFSENLPIGKQNEVHSQVAAYVDNADAERLGWRLARIWREAEVGDTEARGAATGNSTNTVRLTYFETWRKKQADKRPPVNAGPRNTIRGVYPKSLLLPLLDQVTYSYEDHRGHKATEVTLREALEADPQHLLRNIHWQENEKSTNPDKGYANNIANAVKLFDKLTTLALGREDGTVSAFLSFNKLVNDVISEPVVAEEIAPGSRLRQWKLDKGREKQLKAAQEEWQYKIRRGYVSGILKSSHLSVGKLRSELVTAAILSGSIRRIDAFTL